MEKFYEIVTYVSLFLTATIAFLAVIAPVTKTDKDNKVLAVLRFIEEKLMGVLLGLLQKGPAKPAVKSADPKE